MNGDDRPYIMAFSHMMGVGPLAFTRLMRRFGTACAAYNARESFLCAILGQPLTQSFAVFRKEFDVEKKYEEILQKNIQIVTRTDPSFPPQLLHIDSVPICLYVKGDLSRFNFTEDFLFGVVGTRYPSQYGYSVTTRITGDLTRAGMVIVSGMARGIDGAAHRACLDAGGRTIIVLGCGVDIIYPHVNKDLYHKVIESGGIVMSEFPPGMTVQKGLFVSRNRLVTGLCRGVLVVEGSEKSGSLISARFALNQGRDVFAVPGLITSDLARAPHILIREGAIITTGAQDIFDQYRQTATVSSDPQTLPDLPDDEMRIYTLLLRESAPIDAILEQTGFPIQRILNSISLLEIKGLIGKNTDSTYSAVTPA